MIKLDYIYIRAWGRMLGSSASYVDDQVAQARKDKAPANATYRNQDGTWQTMDNVLDNSVGNATREKIGIIVDGWKEQQES